MKPALLAFLLLASIHNSAAAEAVVLWPDGAPGAVGKEAKDIPTLTPYLVEGPTAAAFVVLPGGGYGALAPHEGQGYAQWLNTQGISAFVLKYRLGPAGYQHPAMLQDAARAIRLVRARAAEWKVDAKRIGIMGSSAGGHLASTLLTHFDAGKADGDLIEQQSSRPDLGILCYPVITFGKFTHEGSKRNLLGNDPSPELVAQLSNELQVTKETPPCFVWHTYEDKGVPLENSLLFVEALRKAGVPFDFHVYEKGAHGLGLGSREYDPGKWHHWTRDCAFWLKEHGFAK